MDAPLKLQSVARVHLLVHAQARMSKPTLVITGLSRWTVVEVLILSVLLVVSCISVLGLSPCCRGHQRQRRWQCCFKLECMDVCYSFKYQFSASAQRSPSLRHDCPPGKQARAEPSQLSTKSKYQTMNLCKLSWCTERARKSLVGGVKGLLTNPVFG
jgi:hypothetical protein